MSGTGYSVKTDLYDLFNYVSNSFISHPKELVIEHLKDFFASDSYYHYVRDEWGFAHTPNHTDLPLEAGMFDDTSTRVYIGENYRYDVVFLPAIIVKNGGSRSVPTSMSRDKGSVQWVATKFVDGYGNERIFSDPSYFIQTGSWEGSVIIDVKSRSLKARDELVELISIMFVDTRFEDLVNSGIVIKTVSIGPPSEGDDRSDKLFSQSITLEIKSQWERQIPVGNVLDAINFCIEFGQFTETGQNVAPNLTITTSVELIDNLLEL